MQVLNKYYNMILKYQFRPERTKKLKKKLDKGVMKSGRNKLDK